MDSGASVLLLTNGISLGIIILILSIVYLQSRSSTSSSKLPDALRNSLDRIQDDKPAIEELGQPLFRESVLRKGLRILVPLLALVVSGLLVCAILFPGADVYVRSNDRTDDLPTFFELPLVESMEKLFQSNLTAMGIVFALTTGTLPYTKLTLLLVAFFTPPRILPIRVRETVIQLVGFVGKLCFLQPLMMVVTFNVFKFETDVAPGKEEPIYVQVVPHWSTLCYIGGVVLLTVLGNLVSYCHYSAIDKTLDQVFLLDRDERDKRLKAVAFKGWTLRKHMFERELNEKRRAEVYASQEKRLPLGGWRDFEVKGFKLRFTRCTSILLGLCFCIVVSLTAAIVVSEPFIFDLQIQNDFALRWTGEEFYTPSWTLGSMFSEAPAYRLVQALLIVLVFVVPVLQTGVALVLWFIPLKLKTQDLLLGFAQNLKTWSLMDIFAVMLVVLYASFDAIAESVSQGICEFSASILQELGESGSDVSNGECITWDAKVADGIALPLIQVFFSFLLLKVVLNASNGFLLDRQAFVRNFHNPASIDSASGIPRHLLRPMLCCADSLLISLGIMFPVVVVDKRVNPESSAVTKSWDNFQVPNGNGDDSTLMAETIKRLSANRQVILSNRWETNGPPVPRRSVTRSLASYTRDLPEV